MRDKSGKVRKTRRRPMQTMRNFTLPHEIIRGEVDFVTKLYRGPTPDTNRAQRLGAMLVASVYLWLGIFFTMAGLGAGWVFGQRFGFWPGLILGAAAGPIVLLFIGYPLMRIGWTVLMKWKYQPSKGKI